ncbi:MAG TPA: helix-turn-helix transcriptional regulator [Symbiobacteriaceae bacterium]|nr:helix-turn-helix transcriptional regulator [Symbiobacteriaceae bacterium]
MPPRKPASPKQPFTNGHTLVPGATLYQKVREAISVKKFDDGPWPTAVIEHEGVKAVATVQPDPDGLARLKAPELQKARSRMWELVSGMDDLTADVLDAVACLWIQQAGHRDQMVWLTADQFLAFRGLRPHRNSEGRSSGYKDDQRRRVAEHLERLESTWIDVMELEVLEEYTTTDGKTRRRRRKWKGRSRALIRSSEFGQATITGGVDPYAWKVRPGDVFGEFLLGPGRDVVLLSRKALEYDPYRQDIEKRLARFFAYQWRPGQLDEGPQFTVGDLLEASHKAISAKHPSSTKDRLERALLTLAIDKVITIPGLMEAAAQLTQNDQEGTATALPQLVAEERIVLADFLYPEGRRQDTVGNSKWWVEWQARPVVIGPPPILKEMYKVIAPPPDQDVVRMAESLEDGARPKRRDLVDELVRARETNGLTLADVAAALGVTKGYLSMLERRTRPLSDQMAVRLETWLDQVGAL